MILGTNRIPARLRYHPLVLTLQPIPIPTLLQALAPALNILTIVVVVVAAVVETPWAVTQMPALQL